MSKKITAKQIEDFARHLCEDEKSRATVEKYMRDIRTFLMYAGEDGIGK